MLTMEPTSWKCLAQNVNISDSSSYLGDEFNAFPPPPTGVKSASSPPLPQPPKQVSAAPRPHREQKMEAAEGATPAATQQLTSMLPVWIQLGLYPLSAVFIS